MALQRFMGPGNKPKYIYTDCSQEFEKAAKELGWLHDESAPYRPETNGVAERAVRRVKEGTAATLVQSGFDEPWWDHAMVCFCFLRNVVDLHTISANKNLGSASRKGSDVSQEVSAAAGCGPRRAFADAFPSRRAHIKGLPLAATSVGA